MCNDLLNYKDCRFICKEDITDSQVEQLWSQLEDVMFDEMSDGTLILSEDWQGWVKGTEREIIWKWFDSHYSKGVAYLLYGMEGNVMEERSVDREYYNKRYDEISKKLDKLDGIESDFALWYLLKSYKETDLKITDEDVRKADTVEKYRELVMKRDIAIQVDKLIDILSFGL